MALADPQAITIDGAANSLARTGMSQSASSFTKADGNLRLEIFHQGQNKFRHVIRLLSKKTVADPLVPSQNIVPEMAATFTVTIPKNGYSVDEAAKVAAGLAAFCTVVNLTKIIAGEL